MDDEITIEEEQRVGRLQQARLEYGIDLRKITIEIAQRVAGKLNQIIAQGHDTTAFSIAIALTILNDSLDIILGFLGIGDIPIISDIPGWFITGILFYFLLGKGWFNNTKIKITLWVLGFFFESIPIIDILPATTLSVLWAWHVVRKRARHAEENLEKLGDMTEKELETIEQETQEELGVAV